jgi:hypothetical protein
MRVCILNAYTKSSYIYIYTRTYMRILFNNKSICNYLLYACKPSNFYFMSGSIFNKNTVRSISAAITGFLYC